MAEDVTIGRWIPLDEPLAETLLKGLPKKGDRIEVVYKNERIDRAVAKRSTAFGQDDMSEHTIEDYEPSEFYTSIW